MTDVRTYYSADLMAADLGLTGGLLAGDDGLETAVVLSLFSDRRANPDDVLPDDGGSRRGWWGDLVPATVDGAAAEGDRFGSRLWLLAREKQLPDVLIRARDYAAEALAWLIEDGVAERVEVEAVIVRAGVLGLAVTIVRPRGRAVEFRFDYAWTAQATREVT